MIFWKKMGEVLWNLREILGKNWWSFVESLWVLKKNLVILWKKIGEVFGKIFGELSRKILWNFEKNVRKFWMKMCEVLLNLRKILGTNWWRFVENLWLLKKNLVIHCKKIVEVLGKILVKFWGKCSELLRKIWWNFEKKFV